MEENKTEDNMNLNEIRNNISTTRSLQLKELKKRFKKISIFKTKKDKGKHIEKE